jgi:hypothetical protein
LAAPAATVTMGQIIIHDQDLEAPSNLDILNYKTGGQYRFLNQKRIIEVDELIIHETVTSSAKATVDVLRQRNLGVHLIIGSDGSIHQHGDLRDDFLWHASEHNPKSIGIENVNPYEPKFNPKGSPWTQVIDAPWASAGKYVVPTIEQAEALVTLTEWLLSTAAVGLSIPQKWVGVEDKKMFFGKTPQSEMGPGIYAHDYFGHLDGAWLVLYMWLRMEPLLDPQTAYNTAIQLATGARGEVDLSMFFTGEYENVS